MLEWLAKSPAGWGSAGEDVIIDVTPASLGWLHGGDCAEAFESVHMYDEAIEAAQVCKMFRFP